MDNITSIPFKSAWTRASRIKGWFHKPEAKLLYEFACKVPEDSVIVEVGSYRGRSTKMLAFSRRKVVAIDPLIFGVYSDIQRVADGEVRALKKLERNHPNVIWIRKKSLDCDLAGTPIGLLFIDAIHEAPHPMNDFRHFEPWLVSGAIVAFHDYPDRPGVVECVDDLLSQGVLEKVAQARYLCVTRVVCGK